MKHQTPALRMQQPRRMDRGGEDKDCRPTFDAEELSQVIGHGKGEGGRKTLPNENMNKKEIGQSMPNRHVVSKLKNCDQGFARSNGLFYQAVAVNATPLLHIQCCRRHLSLAHPIRLQLVLTGPRLLIKRRETNKN